MINSQTIFRSGKRTFSSLKSVHVMHILHILFQDQRENENCINFNNKKGVKENLKFLK